MHAAAFEWIRHQIGAAPARVVELGSRDINGSVRLLFAPEVAYVGVDHWAGAGVDVVAEAENYTPPDGAAPDLVICSETLEHARDPEAVARNAVRIAAPGGRVLITCASPARAPHSAVDGLGLRPGEHYRGVSVAELAAWLTDAGAVVERTEQADDRGDTYVAARVPLDKAAPGPAAAAAPPEPHPDPDNLGDVLPFARPTASVATRPLRILLVHPGASWSTHDVYDGLLYGLRTLGAEVTQYRLDTRIVASAAFCGALVEARRKHDDPESPAPTQHDVIYHAGVGIVEMALRQQPDVVFLVSGMLLHPDVLIMLRRIPWLKVVILFTESPYDLDQEKRFAALVDGCWTHERTSVDTLRRVQPLVGYLPHAWHPLKHRPEIEATGFDAIAPAHDVVFVGTGFSERVEFFNAIDWTGIDLGLYGTWDEIGEASGGPNLRPEVKALVRGEQVANEYAAALYRRAKIGINLHRRTKGWSRRDDPRYAEIDRADSLNPRMYELAACGVFLLSDDRAEVRERFGDLVPTFGTPAEAEALIRRWLADDDGRARVRAQLPALVAGQSWIDRAQTVLGDLAHFINRGQAA
jgi:glycosyl transferase family 1/methyltransferase family protein